MEECKFKVGEKCLLPANRIPTSDPAKLRERSPYVSEIVSLGLHEKGYDYTPKCKEVPYCSLRDRNEKKS